MILRCYQVHPGDYGSIVDEIIYNKSQLPARAAELYSETPQNKLRSRVRDQIFLLLSKKKNIQDEEISRELQAVCKMQEVASTKVLNSSGETTAASKGTEPSNTTALLKKDIRDKWVDGAAGVEKSQSSDTDLSVEEDDGLQNTLESQPGTSKGKQQKTVKRKAEKMTSKKNKIKKMERENVKMYNQLLKVILPKAHKLFGSSSSSDSD